MTVHVETPQKIRFLKYMFSHGNRLRSGEIAGQFHIRTASVTRSLHDLSDAGYLCYDPYQGVELTPAGCDFARYLFRRHRIISLMLSRSGLSETDACLLAEKIEHLVPRDHVDQICRSLGHPNRAPCGIIEPDPACCGV